MLYNSILYDKLFKKNNIRYNNYYTIIVLKYV